MSTIHLRDVNPDDIPIFFTHQLDPEANRMAAFTGKDPTDRNAFDRHWVKIMNDPSIMIRTILLGEQVAGYILSHSWFGDLEISYWIDKQLWGRGIATSALDQFLQQQTFRPIFARVAQDNIGSLRVLQKCGFIITGEDKGYAHARQRDVPEYILKLAE